jgi:hypothetical protein
LTYVAYSWDIVEPFVCIAGFGDMLFAALFFSKNGKIWDVDGVSTHFGGKKF